MREPQGPQVRLGLAWALGTAAASVAGPVWLALLTAPVAALAVASTVRSREAVPLGRVPMAASGAAAAAVTVAAAAGPVPAMALAGMVAAGILLGAVRYRQTAQAAALQVLIVLAPAGAASGLVLSRGESLPAGLVLAGTVCLYDAAAFLIGTGARWPWQGPLAGLATIAAFSLLVAAVAVPPFRGASPWILGGLAAALAPLGPVVASRLVGHRAANVPALRRLDSLLLLGPAWAIAAATLLRP